jgi:hypothetical protein
MKLTSYDGFVWGNSGYWVSTDDATMLVNDVQPQILNRPGTYPTFGLSIIGAMFLTCQIGYEGPLPWETAFLNFYKRINPANINIAPGTNRILKALRNDGVELSIKAMAMIPQASSSGDFNIKDITFVCAEPFWTDSSYTTGTGGYS